MLSALLTIGLLIVVIGFVAVHILWYIHPDRVETAADFTRRINSGQPVIIEFFSNL
ncbi:MAG: hypothetical protein IT324_28740 [Anaerolineae bacterium]|nr:hypothetical protein [Anaerolineae bacterium]